MPRSEDRGLGAVKRYYLEERDSSSSICSTRLRPFCFARQMPVLIVNSFEVVEIRENHAHRMFLAVPMREFALQGINDFPAVQQSRQSIIGCCRAHGFTGGDQLLMKCDDSLAYQEPGFH